MGYWENKFKEFFKEEINKNFAYPIFSRFLFGQITGGEKRKKLNDINYYRKHFFDLIEELYELDEGLKEYTASFFPTLIAPKQAENFYLRNERKPDKEELYCYLYLISSGIYTNNGFLINLLTEKEEGWESFVKKLKNEEAAIFIKKENNYPNGLKKEFLMKYLYVKINFPPITKNIFIFILINFFVVWWLKEKNKITISSLDDLDKKLEKAGIDKTATLVLFDYSGREKKKVFFYPRINKFIEQWYFDYLKTGDKKHIFLPKFLSNFLINDKQFKDLSLSYLDKFLYYLLRGHINGEILDKLINLRIKYNFKNKIYYPILGADKFYASIKK